MMHVQSLSLVTLRTEDPLFGVDLTAALTEQCHDIVRIREGWGDPLSFSIFAQLQKPDVA
jgi:hypothetical protein